MTCARCEELAAEVAWLRGELGLDADSPQRVALMSRALKLTASRAAVLLALHAAHGRVLSKAHLEERTRLLGGERESKIVDVYVSHLRQSLGRETIETVRGLGYRLTANGMKIVDAALAGLASDARSLELAN